MSGNRKQKGVHNTVAVLAMQPELQLFKSMFRLITPICTQITSTKDASLGSSDEICRVGIAVAGTAEEFYTGFEDLIAAGCSKVVLWALEEELPWRTFVPSVDGRFQDYTAIARTPEELRKTVENECKNARPSHITKIIASAAVCLRAIHASRLQRVIGGFSHNTRNDVPNVVLAPARILYKSRCRSSISPFAVQHLKKFCAHVVTTIKGKPEYYGPLGQEWLMAIQPFRGGARVAENDYERLLHLFTEVRTLSGTQVNNGVSAFGDNSPIGSKSGKTKPKRGAHRREFRILVIDDHVMHWQGVLNEIQTRVEEAMGCSLKIEVSHDEEHAYPLGELNRIKHTIKLWSALPDYDLMLLDIYLGNRKNGLKLLNDIRLRCLYLPVILWTTSTDKELPAKAALANGYIFKKSATLPEMVATISSWLESGRGRRLWSLPNPFFDHVIRDPAQRDVALAFTKWTLRYMDCFHAIDDFHFRYFNDHGGRHIIGILGVMEKLLRPFLLDESGRVLAMDNRERSFDIFCLYIAVLCHEYGMFPIMNTDPLFDVTRANTRKEAEKMRADTRPVVEARRKIHAIRGMMLLASSLKLFGVAPTSRYKRRVAGIGHSLKLLRQDSDPMCGLVVALLVGYHQRLLLLGRGTDGSDDFLHFGRGAKRWEKVRDKLKNANAALGQSGVSIAGIKAVLGRARATLSVNRQSRLRGQCAILRFADALDVDHTRAPADFLLEERLNRRPLQDVEDCKRIVCAECTIDRGLVSIGFVVPQPGASICKIMLPLFRESVTYHTRYGKNQEETDEAKEAKAWVDGFPSSGREDSLDQFLLDLLNAWKALDPRSYLDQGWVRGMKGFLTHGVAGYFVLCDPQKSGEAVLSTERRKYLQKAQPAVSSAAALLVLLEILDEYCVIVDAGLDDVVRLNPNLRNDDIKSAWRQDQGEVPFILKTALSGAKDGTNGGGKT